MANNSANSSLEFTLTDNTLYLKNDCVLHEVDRTFPRILKVLHGYAHQTLVINLDELSRIDSAGVAAIDYIREHARKLGIDVHHEGGSEQIRNNMKLLSYAGRKDSARPAKTGLIEQVGEGGYRFFKELIPHFLFFTADLFYWSVIDLFKRKMHRRGEVINQAVLIGVNAVLIVAVMAFLIGAVLAMQSAYQLRDFGANIFIVDLTVIAMMREMGPLITAVLVAGRSGSAIASEVATMKITEEMDALKTMGLNPIRFVIVPKMQAGIMTIPFLTIIANVMGIAGGMLIAYVFLDITPVAFFNRMGESLYNRDIITGVVKSIVFIIVIVQTSSFSGTLAERGATDVGRVTTMAVVLSISMVILADSILGLIFY
jgi:phospholipid/cholesterol/gamma-HCH transport system permease protein